MVRLIKVIIIVFAIAVFISPQWITHARLTPLSVDNITNLSGLMVAGGEVNSFEISPDGNYVVFRADKDLAGKMELYSVDLQSLELEKLNENIPDDYDISNILISPDSQWVVYSVITSSSGRYLRSVPIGGGNSYLITHPFHSSSDNAKGFEITPDSANVIFNSDYVTEDFYELYKSPITGVYIDLDPGESVLPEKLNAGLPVDHYVSNFDISPNGTFIIFTSQSGGYRRAVWHVAINGGTNTKISTDITGLAIADFLITPNNNRVVYRMLDYGITYHRLYSVPTTGGTATRLDKPGLSEGVIEQYRISSNSAYVVFTGNLDDASKVEIYSVPIAGPDSSMIKLNGSFVNGGNIDCGIDNNYHDFALSPDGAQVIFCADYLVDGRYEIFKRSISGGSVVIRLSQAITAGNGAYHFKISPDSSRVVYYGKFDDATYYKGYSLPINGGTPTQVAGFSSLIERHVWGITISPDSSRVILNIGTSLSGTEGYRLYQSAIDGGPAQKLIVDTANPGHVYFRNESYTSDDKYLIFISDMDTDGIDELYLTDATLQMNYLPVTINP